MGGFRDGGHLGGVTRWNSQFLAIIHVASQLLLCLFWISLWLRIGVYNTLGEFTGENRRTTCDKK